MSDWVEVPTKDSGKDSDWETVDHSDLEPKKEGASQSQTALEHFGNGASFGYLPQLQALAEKGIDWRNKAEDKILDVVGLDHLTSIDHQLQKQGFKLPDSTYLDVRDHNIKRLKKEAEDNPLTAGLANVAGGVTSGIAAGGMLPSAGAATALGRMRQAGQIGAIYGAAQNPGDREGEFAPIQLGDRADNAAKGAVLGAGTAGLVEGAKALPDALSRLGEKSIKNATGATGAQLAKFEDGAGRQLYDRKLVKFGDSPANVAERVGGAMDEANAQIDSALKTLDAKGVKASADNVVSELQSKISALEKDPSQAGVVKKLKGIVEDIVNAGESSVSVSAGEQTKRGFNKMAGNWMDPEVGQAGKQAYGAYRSEVERAAEAADPSLASKFKTGKETHGLLAPIQEAAERRAATTSQSPLGGFMDVGTALGGFAAGGPIASVAAPIARRVIAPRMASSAGTAAFAASDFLKRIPSFAKLAQNNPSAFQAAVANFSRKAESGGMRAADAGGDQSHVVSEDDAKQQFLDGN